MIRVVVADDQALIRAGFRSILERDTDIVVVGEAADGAAAVRLAHDVTPDVVLMDVRMPELDGIAATRRIAADPGLAHARVIVVTTYDVDDNVFGALAAGASGFLLKDVEPDELRRAVHVVAAGDALLAPGVTRRLIGRFVAGPSADRSERADADAAGRAGHVDAADAAGRADPAGRVDADAAGAAARADAAGMLALLTAREREIVARVAEGLSNDEIAARLFISPTTVKTHASHAMLKLNARDRAQLVVFAYRAGIAG